jgi:hypothetical protein
MPEKPGSTYFWIKDFPAAEKNILITDWEGSGRFEV